MPSSGDKGSGCHQSIVGHALLRACLERRDWTGIGIVSKQPKARSGRVAYM